MNAYQMVIQGYFGASAATAHDFDAGLLALLQACRDLDGSAPAASGNVYRAVLDRWTALGLPEFFLREARQKLNHLSAKFDRGGF